MLKSLILAPLAALLAGCAALPLLLGGMTGQPAPQAAQTASAPLARTTWDESAYRTALATANTTRLTINALIAAHQITPGSPKALRIRGGLIALRDSLRAARALLDALNDPVSTLSVAELTRKADEYRAAMAAATTAAETIGEALSGETATADEGLRIRFLALQARINMVRLDEGATDAERDAVAETAQRLAEDMQGHDIALITR